MNKKSKIFFLFSGISLISVAVIRFLLGAWIPFLWIPLGLFALFVILAFWSDRKMYKEFFSLKTTKQGMSMGGLIGLVLILLIAINFIGARKYKTFDFSLGRVNTLSDQTIKLVKNLDEDLKVIYFYKKGEERVEETRRAFIELIKKYQDQSDRVKLQFVEMNERPDLVEQYGVTEGTGVVFLDYKGRKNKIDKIDEQEITGALVKVTREQEKVIYFVSGHGEKDTEVAGTTGVGAFKMLLEGNRYAVKNLSLLQVTEIPKDANLVAVLGPTQSFLQTELTVLEAYLKQGGALILALEPKTSHGLTPLLDKMGIEVANNYVLHVVDTPLGRAMDPRMTPGPVFSTTHQITQPFGKNQMVSMRLPTALQKKSGSSLQIEDLVQTPPSSMAFQDTGFAGEGKSGPFTVAMAIKGKWAPDSPAEFSAVVFGDSDIFSNEFLYQHLNRDLALNSVASLVKEESIISITPKEVGATELNVTPMQFYVFIFGFVIPLPLILMITSGVIWFRRRYA